MTGRPDVMASGSENVLVTGTGKTRIFKGVTVKGGVSGSQVMMNAGDDYVGLGAYNETGLGSIFKVLGAFFFIGAGLFYRNGVSTGASASTTLQIKTVASGTLGTTYQAGMAQPSAPVITAITPPSGFTGKNNGVVSVQIARVRSATGARSNASPTSNTVQTINQSVAITFPLADSNGQDYWEIDVSKNGEGGIGNHFFLQEVPESVVAASVTASRIATNTTSIGVANGTLSATHIGWAYTSSGDVNTYITGVGAADSYSAGFQSITLAVANGSTNTQNATFTRAVAGVTRSFVVEWKDADIAGSDFSPIRDYPPPAALFGGVLEDVTFVDGAFGDTVNITQYAIRNSLPRQTSTPATYPGNAIAVSDPARPESYPPDNYIFTGDAPTALMPGAHGMYWRFAKNSLGVIRYVGGSPALSYEKIWHGVGIQNQRQACLGAGGRLYAYTGARGAVRLGIGGEPDNAFAARVADDMANWTAANVVLGYDANNQYVFYAHGRTVLAYYEPGDVWCAPLTLPVATVGGSLITSIVTVNGAAYLAMDWDADTAIKLYDFDVGSGSAGKVATSWKLSDDVTDVVSRLYISGRFDTAANDLYVAIRKNGVTSDIVASNVNISSTGLQHLPVMKPNLRECKSFQIFLQYTSAGGDAGFESIEVDGLSSGIPQ